MFNRKHLILGMFISIFFSQHLFSQYVIQGKVTDNGNDYLGNGAEAVENALVTIIDQADTSRFYSAITDEQGYYLIEIPQTEVHESINKPDDFGLSQNYPNPFNPSTIIHYQVPKPCHVTIEIYNVLGQKVKTLLDNFISESGQVIWDATDDLGRGVSAGIYIYSLKSEGIRINRKMLLTDGKRGEINTTASTQNTAKLTRTHGVNRKEGTQYLFMVTGENITQYEQEDLEITESMTYDVSVSRTITDIDGNVYQTVKIGDQWWLAENLKVIHYRNGDPIINVTDTTEWVNLTAGAYCNYNSDTTNAVIYGKLYNGYTLTDSLQLAPQGWHIPNDGEWKLLELHLGMNELDVNSTDWRGYDEGGKLKSIGTTHWDAPNSSATNTSNFSALPGGFRDGYTGFYKSLRDSALFWTASDFDSTHYWGRCLNDSSAQIGRFSSHNNNGYSVRCVRDAYSPESLSFIKITPAIDTLENNQSWQFKCIATYSDSSTQDVTLLASLSLSPGIAGSIDASGLFTSDDSTTGLETISVTFQSKSAQIDIQVIEPPIKYSPDFVRLNDSTMESIVQFDSLGTITLPTSSETDEIGIGSIIASKPTDVAHYGFLKKVVGKTTIGGEVVLETENASLDEVFEKADISIEKHFVYEDVKQSYQLPKGMQLLKSTSTEGFYFKISNVVIYDYDKNLSTDSDQIRMNGYIYIDPTVKFHCKYSLLGGLKEFLFESTVVQTTELKLWAGVSYNPEFRLVEFPLGQIVFLAGGVPVVMDASLSIDIGAYVSLGAELESGMTSTNTIVSGLQYHDNGWSIIADHNETFDFIEPKLNLKATAKGYVGPQLNFKLYGLAGPYAELNAYFELEAEPLNVPWWELYAGFDVDVGVEMKVLSKKIVDYHVPAVIGYRELIAQATDNPPTASFTVAPLSGDTDTNFQCDASGSSDNEDATAVLEVRWDWENDGTWDTGYSTTKTASHQYASAGKKTINLQVKDTGGLTASATKQITVEEGGTIEYGTMTDQDGNTYKTVKIGNQWWMAENLKVTHYRNGDAIPNVTDNTEWTNLTTGAYCAYANNASNVSTYGRLYNWHAVNDSRNIAPAGWHVPTDAEWQTLVDYLGGNNVAGGKMKESGTTHWLSPNTGATNESGFSALPGGLRDSLADFSTMGLIAYFWSSSEDYSVYVWSRLLLMDDTIVWRLNYSKTFGFSVRLVRD